MKKDICTFEDFSKTDIRVGEIMSAVPVTGSKKLLLMTVDIGPDYGVVEILAGIALSYTPENLIHNKFLFVANLAPRKMAEKISNGMILAASKDGKPYLIQVPSDIPAGTCLS